MSASLTDRCEALGLTLPNRAAEKNMAFGEYPLVTLKEARELHFAAQKTLETGIDPMAERRAEATPERVK